MSLRKTPTWIPGPQRGRTGARRQVAWPDVRVDALFDTYLEWRDECEAVERAYERWSGSERAERRGGSERAERRLAYAAYRAALDREEKAAAVYQVAAAQLVGGARAPHGGERWH